jgi:hypothetical protein
MGIAKALAGGSLGCLVLLGCGKTVPLDANTSCPCASGWTCCDTVCLPPGDVCGPAIDDMTRPRTSMKTSWYAYSDRTCPLSCPPLTVQGSTGTLIPEEGQPFSPSPSRDGGPEIDGGIWPYREVTGGGETDWGVGFGFDFKDMPGKSPLAECPSHCGGTPLDAATDSIMSSSDPADSGTCKDGYYASQPVLLDESHHVGISFWAQSLDASDAGPLTLTVLVSDVHTAYVGRSAAPNDPDVCDPCAAGGGVGACGDDFAFHESLTPEWTQYVVYFSQLAQAGWSRSTGSPAVSLDTKSLGHVNFEIQTQMNVPVPAFKVRIAYVQWVDAPTDP